MLQWIVDETKRLSLLVVLIFCTGCSVLVASPEVQVKDVGIVGLDSKGVEFELLLTVTNPNPYTMKLMGYNYDLKVMALPLVKGGAREFFEFKGNGATTDVRLPARVSLNSLYEILKRRPDPDNVPYTLVAGLEVETPLGSHLLPVEKSGVFTVPERYRPEFYLKQFRNIGGDWWSN